MDKITRVTAIIYIIHGGPDNIQKHRRPRPPPHYLYGSEPATVSLVSSRALGSVQCFFQLMR